MNHFVLIAFLIFASCSGQQTQEEELGVFNISDTIVNELVQSESILVDNKISHHFSSKETKDEFHVYLKGDSIISGTVVFTISNQNLDEIYHEEFASEDLIGWGMDDSIDRSTLAQEEYIKKRINEFFNEENFTKPAIDSDGEFDGNYSDQSTWNDIQSDPSAIGFHYYIGKEDGRWIAFSKKLKKVVLYFNCC